jgi:hypothetical protein
MFINEKEVRQGKYGETFIDYLKYKLDQDYEVFAGEKSQILPKNSADVDVILTPKAKAGEILFIQSVTDLSKGKTFYNPLSKRKQVVFDRKNLQEVVELKENKYRRLDQKYDHVVLLIEGQYQPELARGIIMHDFFEKKPTNFKGIYYVLRKQDSLSTPVFDLEDEVIVIKPHL